MNIKRTLIISTVLVGFIQLSLTTSADKKRKIPFGTQYVKPLDYYVDKEVMNMLSWREFYFHTKRNQGDSVASLYMPDTNVIIERYGSNAFAPAPYKDSAVVGLTTEQVEQYCKWRTEVVQLTKRLAGTTVSYHPLDSAMYAHLSSAGQVKGIKELSSAIPELVRYANEYKIHISKDSAVSYKDYKGTFGFRCVAKYK